MNLEKAYSVLELTSRTDVQAVKAAKRRLVSILHPDRHPKEQSSLFCRLTAEVVEAAEAILAHLQRVSSGEDYEYEHPVDEPYDWDEEDETDPQSDPGVSVLLGRTSSDGDLQIRINSLQAVYEYSSCDSADDTRSTTRCARLNLTFSNRGRKLFNGLNVASASYLVDCEENIYPAIDHDFCWIEREGNFRRHGEFIFPRTRLDGFILFPMLRDGVEEFARYLLVGEFWIGMSDDGETRIYDISLNEESSTKYDL